MNTANNIILEIKDLCVSVGSQQILNGINLTVRSGEVHAIMGRNGSGKSTLGKVIAGHPSYRVLSGDILFEGLSILDKTPEERAQMGIFLGFQYPVEVPGVLNIDFLRFSFNSRRRFRGLTEVEPLDFLEVIQPKLDILGMDPTFLTRNLNDGFSGGEKKRNEVLQMALLDTRVAILDEMDSGLDIDALRVVANGVNTLLDGTNSVILITHYQRLLDYITPNYVHVMRAGKVIKTGSMELAMELERDGYSLVQEGNL